MKSPILVVAPHFPVQGRAQDGQGRYVVESTLALKRSGRSVHVICLRFGQDPEHEQYEGIEISRVAPREPMQGPFLTLGLPPVILPRKDGSSILEQ